MKSSKFDESKAPINIDEDRQTHNPEDLEADESYESEADLEQDPSPSASMIVKKSPSLASRILNFLKTLIDYSALAAVFMLCQASSANYFEINQVCPYDNDFECYYRYLLCEGDCNPSKPLYKQGFDFVVEPRKHEFLLDTRLADIITKLLIISVIYALILAVGLLKKGARLYPVIVAINVAYLRTYRDGEDHGDYSKILGTWLVILVSGLGLLFTSTVLLARLNSKGKMYAWTVYGGIILLLASVVVGLGYRFFDSCGNWDKGLYGESIDNDVNCQFSKPTVCLYEFFGDAYDYNRWLLMSPKDRKPHWNLMNEKYANVTKIGFPMMTSATKDDRLAQNVQNYVSSNIREVTETNEKNYEVVLHRTYDDKTETYRDPAWIDINIQFNKELVEQRSSLVSNSIADNVIVIYLDSLSRAGAFRQLPETMKLFENMAPKVHQFFKYHSATPTTLGNMYPLFYGISEPFKPTVPKQGITTSFLHDYKEKGFITGRALSSCVTSTMAGANFYYIDDEPFDHIGNGWACDVNAIGKDPEESTTGPLSMLRRSVYGKEISEYVIDYGKKFLDTYKNQKKLLWLDFLDFHDFTFSQGKYLDGHLSKFLSEMDLSQTMLMLVSDNGQHLFKHELFSFFRSTEIEKAAPALFVKLPKSAENEFGSGLEKNKQQLIQGYDINKLLRAIPNPETASETMLHKLPEKTKSCDFPVLDQECQCILPANK